MSDILRKTLMGRLQSSENQRDKTPPLGRLVPKLNLNQDKSCSTLRKEKLQPISPFLTKRTENATETTERDKIMMKTKEVRKFNRKYSINKISKLTPLHFHGDTKFLGTSEVEVLEFIKTIKGNQEFHEDFWYFNKGIHFYDLILTTFLQKNPHEYFTLSYRGISHFFHGEVQFISLDEWEREYYLFKKFSSISFFNKYRKWKTFSIWMKRRRLNMIEQRRQFLKSTLPFLDDDLQKTFLSTRSKCFILSKIDFLDLSADRTRTLPQFLLDQKEKIQLKQKDLTSFHDNLFISIRSTCSQTTDKFIRSNITGSILDKGESVSSKVLPYTHEAVMRNHLQHLGRFIKVMDLMVLDAKYYLCTSLYLKVLSYLKITPRERMNKAGKHIFLIFSSFEGLEFKSAPEIDQFKQAVEKLIKKCIKHVFSFDTLELHTDFRNYFRALNEFSQETFQISLKPETILSISPEIVNNNLQISNIFRSYSEEIQEFGLTWQSHFKQHSQNLKLKLKKIVNHDILSLNHIFERYKKQLKTFRSLPDNTILSIFKVDLSEIKNKLIPTTVQILENLRKFLPNLANTRADALFSELNSINSKLFSVPKDIHEYIALLDSIKLSEEKAESVALGVLDLKDFIKMLESQYINVSSDLREKSNEISKLYEKMRNRLSFLFARQESDKAKFIKILRNDVKNVNTRLEKLQDLLNTKDFKNVQADPRTNFGLLNSAKAEVEIFHKECQDFSLYQEILSIPKSDFTLANNAVEHFHLLYTIWKSLSSWEYKHKQWAYTPLKDLNTTELKKDLEKFLKSCLKTSSLGPENPVPDYLTSKIEKVQKLGNIVETLQHPAIKPKHWQEIESIAGFSVDISNGITFGTASSKDLQNFSDQISQVVEKAQKEEEIERLARELLEIWELEEFELMNPQEKEEVIEKKMKRYRTVNEEESIGEDFDDSENYVEDEDED